MNCPRCRHENPAEARFCMACGAGLPARCAACGTELAAAARFCFACGQPVSEIAETPKFGVPGAYTPKHLAEKILATRSALEGERKHVTVLFCDIASSTALADRLGAETMHTVLNQFFDLALAEVHRYEGTVNQFLGDGLMALFGAPVAHEDHARRAVLAAIGIRQALCERPDLGGAPAIEVRMGVHTGPVVVGRIGDNLRMDYTAVGDTTNLAARLQQHAEPGTICISQATARQVEGHVRVEKLDPFPVKGKAEPVRAFTVVGPVNRRPSPLDARRDRPLSQFVGRGRELQTLRDCLAEATGGRGQVVGVVGEPGVGKSRLLYEFRRSVREERVMVVEGRCLSYGGAMPYVPLQDLLRDACGIAETDTPAQIGEKLRTALVGMQMNAEEGVPYLLRLLGVTEGTEPLIEVGHEMIKARIFENLRQIMLRGSRQRPWIFLLEDLHWVDRSSEEYFVSATESLVSAPVLLVATYRPGYRPPWIDKSYATQVALRPLLAAPSARIVHSAAESIELPDSVVAMILERGDGNPFHLEELTRIAVEHGAVTPSSAVPETVQGVLMARIDRLPEGLKRILQTASVLGREFSTRLLTTVWPEAEPVETSLAELMRLEFLYEQDRRAERAYVFKHALTQEVAYDSVLTPRRRALHEAAGQAIESLYPERTEEHCEVLAHHYSRSGNVDKALHYLDRANSKAAKASAMQEAKLHFDAAMTLLDTLPATEANDRRRISLLVAQGWVINALLRFPEYHALLMRYERTAAALADPGLLGALYARRCWSEWSFGDFDRAVATAERAVEHCAAAGNLEDAAQAYCHWQWSHLCRGAYDEVFTLETEILRLLEPRVNLRLYLFAVTGASLAHAWRGNWNAAVEEGEKALRIGTESADDGILTFAAFILSHAYTAKGDLPRALSYGELAVGKAPTPGDKVWSQSFLAWAYSRGGRPREGIALLEPAVAMQRAARFIWSEVCALFLGECYWRAGEYEKATRTLGEMLEVAGRCGMRFLIGSAHRILGELAMEAEAGDAPRHFETSIAALEAIGAENELALACAGYGRWHARGPTQTMAREYLTRALTIFERLETLREPDRVRAELARLSG